MSTLELPISLIGSSRGHLCKSDIVISIELLFKSKDLGLIDKSGFSFKCGFRIKNSELKIFIRILHTTFL